MSRFISSDTATTASHAWSTSFSIQELRAYPAPSCSFFHGRSGSREWTVATSFEPYVSFANAPAKFVYQVCVCTKSASIGSDTMFTLNERTSHAFANLGSGAARPWTDGRYRQTFRLGSSGGGPVSNVRTWTSTSLDSAVAMYFAWTPAPP